MFTTAIRENPSRVVQPLCTTSMRIEGKSDSTSILRLLILLLGQVFHFHRVNLVAFGNSSEGTASLDLSPKEPTASW